MKNIFYIKKIILSAFISILIGCGGSVSNNNEVSNSGNSDIGGSSPTHQSSNDNNSSSNNQNSSNNQQNSQDEFSQTQYRGLQFYPKKLSSSDYTLEQLNDYDFNALSKEQKLIVANNLLNSLFFGYPLKELKSKINSGKFISSIKDSLKLNKNNIGYIENHILDNDYFYQYDSTKTWAKPQVLTILTRFYAMNKLDRYYYNNWIAYILTQTIMFSPAEELSSTHTPDMANVYNRLVNMLSINSGMRYITYVHMQSQENWRRFRSPEDNGREMLEIYTLDTKDSDVPLAAKALQNWKLNTDSDTLEVALNKNTTPLNLFGTTVTTGEDFYRELVKSKAFQKGVTKRLVDFFFPNKTKEKKEELTNTIVASNPETWQDILTQILFSKEYLLHNNRPLSAEERFYSFTKKTDFKVVRREFYNFRVALENMHQAVMKYKLGKIDRVPLDTLSFAYYHKYIREHLFMNFSYEMDKIDRDNWRYDGISDNFFDWKNFEYDSSDDPKTLKSFVTYIFNAVIGRNPTDDEIALFKSHFITNKDGKELFKDEFNIFKSYSDKTKEAKEQLSRKKNMAFAILDYLSRLQDSYTLSEVE